MQKPVALVYLDLGEGRAETAYLECSLETLGKTNQKEMES